MASWIRSVYNASRARDIVKEFHDCRTRIELIRQDIWFNTQCKQYNLTPKFINIKHNNASVASSMATRAARSVWLNAEIRSLHSKKQALTDTMYKLHLEIGKHDFDGKINFLYWKHEEALKVILDTKRSTLCKKLHALSNEWRTSPNTAHKAVKHRNTRGVNTFSFHDRVINTTDVVFTRDELDILNVGHKHNIATSYNNTSVIKKTIVESEACVQFLPYDQREHARHLLTETILDCQAKERAHPRPTVTNNVLGTKVNQLSKKVKQLNLVITKADKGNSTVIMNKQEYVDKTVDFLFSNHMTISSNDPTNMFQKQVKNALKDTHATVPSRVRAQLINMNPSAPTLKAYPKIHKPDTPIRPITNFRSAPAYKLAKFLQQYLKSNYVFSCNRSMTSSAAFAQHIHNLKLLNTHRMMSLDIKDMYSNIPVTDTLDIIQNNMENNPNISSTECDDILILIRVATNQNYFMFDNTIYIQNHGLPMGSPLSGTLANIYVDHLENKFLESFNKNNAILEWNRYIDDIFLIYDSTKVSHNHILDNINEQHANIKFTMETESNMRLNHLDLTISRNNNSLSVNIYRKPTTTNHTIHNTSCHPHTHKLAAYRFMVNRMLTLPLSNNNIKKETLNIKHIASANGFSTQVVDNLIRKHLLKSKKVRYNVADKPTQTWYTPFTFVNENTYRITNMLKRKYGVTPAYATRNTIKNSLHNNNIEVKNKYDRSGVYLLTCQNHNCNSTYVGQTGRSFNIRYSEHTKGMARHKPTAFSEHIAEKNHCFTSINNDLSILHFAPKGRKLNTLEDIEIHSNRLSNYDNLNEQIGYHTNILFSLLPAT